jgi:hypothetical protein
MVVVDVRCGGNKTYEPSLAGALDHISASRRLHFIAKPYAAPLRSGIGVRERPTT